MGTRKCLPFGIEEVKQGRLNRLLRKELFPYRSSGVNFKKAVESLCVLERHKHVTLRKCEVKELSASVLVFERVNT